MTASLTMRGATGLQHRLSTISAQAETETSRAIDATTSGIAARARGLAPVRTGRLRSAITARASGLSGRVVVDVPYAVFVEFGTVRVPARPFLRPAREAEAAALTVRVLDIGQRLERVWSSGSFV